MPIFDSNLYSSRSVGRAVMAMVETFEENGQKPEDFNLYLLNVFFGYVAVVLEEMEQFHVCRPAAYGYITVVFHEVPSGEVLKEQLPVAADNLVTCATILWFANDFEPPMLADGISVLNDIAKSLELNTGTACFINVSPAMLPPIVEVEHVGKKQKILVGMAQQNAPVLLNATVAGLVPWEQFDKRSSHENPDAQKLYMQSAVWQGKAIRAIANGDSEFAVVACETWIETLTIRLAAELNRMNGTPIADLKGEVIKGLAKFITTHLGVKFLKGHWDCTNEATEFGRWHSDCWGLRNAVVHTGKHPTMDEARQAYKSAHELAWYITERLATLKGPAFAEVKEHFKFLSDWKKMERVRRARS